MIDPVLYGVLLPLGLAALLAWLAARLAPGAASLGVIVGVALLVGLVGLEGVPAFPPVAAKQKLAYAVVAALAAGALAPASLRGARLAGGAALTAALATAVWVGWRPLSADADGAWAALGAVVLVAGAIALVAAALDARGNALDSGPVFLMTAAGLAATAGYGGSATLAFFCGAVAGAVGGAMLTSYLRGFAGASAAALGPPALLALTSALAGIAAILVYFTPETSRLALALAATAPLAVLGARGVPLGQRLEARLRPVLGVAAGGLPALASLFFAARAASSNPPLGY